MLPVIKFPTSLSQHNTRLDFIIRTPSAPWFPLPAVRNGKFGLSDKTTRPRPCDYPVWIFSWISSLPPAGATNTRFSIFLDLKFYCLNIIILLSFWFSQRYAWRLAVLGYYAADPCDRVVPWRRSSAVRLLGFSVRIPPEACMSVSRE